MSEGERRILEAHFGEGVEEKAEGSLLLYVLPVVTLPEGCSPAKAFGVYVASVTGGYQSRLFLDRPITLKSGIQPPITTLILLGRTMHAASVQGVSVMLPPHQAILAHLSRYEQAS